MAGCEGCLLTEKELDALIRKVENQAKADAITNNKVYILYRSADGGVGHMEMDAARAAGVSPFKFVSQFTPTNNG